MKDGRRAVFQTALAKAEADAKDATQRMRVFRRALEDLEGVAPEADAMEAG